MLALVATVVTLVAVVAVAVVWRGDRKPAAPAKVQLKPSQHFSDDADMMRRLQRKNLVTTTSR